MAVGAPKACTTCGKAGCTEHVRKPWEGAGKGRGGRPWRRLRQQVLDRDHWLCQTCKREGRVTQAQEVDHIKPVSQGGDDSLANLEAICKPCHRRKTASESRPI